MADRADAAWTGDHVALSAALDVPLARRKEYMRKMRIADRSLWGTLREAYIRQ